MKYAGPASRACGSSPAARPPWTPPWPRIPPDESLYILAGYTPMRELRRIMQRRGWVPPFWEE